MIIPEAKKLLSLIAAPDVPKPISPRPLRFEWRQGANFLHLQDLSLRVISIR